MGNFWRHYKIIVVDIFVFSIFKIEFKLREDYGCK